MIEIILIIIIGISVHYIFKEDKPSEPLSGMSNPILFEEMREKYFKK